MVSEYWKARKTAQKAQKQARQAAAAADSSNSLRSSTGNINFDDPHTRSRDLESTSPRYEPVQSKVEAERLRYGPGFAPPPPPPPLLEPFVETSASATEDTFPSISPLFRDLPFTNQSSESDKVRRGSLKYAPYGSAKSVLKAEDAPFVHPSRLALLVPFQAQPQQPRTPSPGLIEEEVSQTPIMSPGILTQTRINPFQTSLGSNSTPVARAKREEEKNRKHEEAEEALPQLVNAAAPDCSKIVVARQYLFQHECEEAGLGDEGDVSGRLLGVGLIEAVRRVLRMPIKTYGTACVFYHRYRYHVATSDEKVPKYDYRDAALACLWLASKAEETPKKSKEILCAARNLSLPVEDHMTPDDETFENQSKLMITLERLLLEIVAFDFRARNSADVLAGLCHETHADKTTGTAALAICLDVHRTLAVLKQTRQTLACACLELAARFLDEDVSAMITEELYQRVGSSRGEITETIRDLIDLYMNHQPQTVAGPRFTLNDFMRVSISITTEMREKSLPRYTYYHAPPPKPPGQAPTTSPTTSPQHSDPKSVSTIQNTTPRTPSGPLSTTIKATNGHPPPTSAEMDIGDPRSPPPDYFIAAAAAAQDSSLLSASPTSPTSPIDPPNPDDPSQISSVVRFVLDASRAHDEKLSIAPYYDIITEEVVEEKEIWIPKGPRPSESSSANLNSTTTRGPTRIHGGFLSRGSGTDAQETPRRTYTPPPSSNYHNRGRNSSPPRRGEYNRRDASPPRRHDRSPMGRGGYVRRGDDRRDGGYRRNDDRRSDDRRR